MLLDDNDSVDVTFAAFLHMLSKCCIANCRCCEVQSRVTLLVYRLFIQKRLSWNGRRLLLTQWSPGYHTYHLPACQRLAAQTRQWWSRTTAVQRSLIWHCVVSAKQTTSQSVDSIPFAGDNSLWMVMVKNI